MLIDLTLKISLKLVLEAQGNETKALDGHLGTHFDVMNKEFPLEYVQRPGIVLDISGCGGEEVALEDVDLSLVGPGMFVAFYTGFVEAEGYGGKRYFSEHPQLSHALIEALVARRVSLIGVDFAGVRRGAEHIPMDQYCADHGVFVVENLCSLKRVLEEGEGGLFEANTYPVNFSGWTGLPCRVVARV